MRHHLENRMRLLIGILIAISTTAMSAWNTVPPDAAGMGAK